MAEDLCRGSAFVDFLCQAKKQNNYSTYFQLQNDKQLSQYLLFLNQELLNVWKFCRYSNYGTGAGTRSYIFSQYQPPVFTNIGYKALAKQKVKILKITSLWPYFTLYSLFYYSLLFYFTLL